MKPLNVRFDSSAFEAIDAISDRTKLSKSDIARAAMQIGLRDLEKLNDTMVVGKVNIAKLRIMFNGDEDVVNEMLEQSFDGDK